MHRYRMGLTIKELIALDAASKLRRSKLTKEYARQMAASVFRGMLSHPPNVVNRVDKVDRQGNIISYDLSHRRHRGQRTRP